MTSKPRIDADTAAIVANWRFLQEQGGSSSCAAVVKANAYGLGIERVAPALARAGCRTFFVAHTSEGVALRRLLADVAIVVLHGPQQPELLMRHRLIPVLNNPADLVRWPQPAWLHVDTGMNRLGFSPADLPEGDFQPLGLMSHLACADEPGHPMNPEQLRAFRTIQQRYREVPASLANSAGIFLGRNYHFDLLRPGLALYGGNPVPGQPNPMQRVITVRAPVLQVREIPEGATTGYGGIWRADRPSRLATIECGYADGLMRTLSGRGVACVHGTRVPFAGRVSMDLVVLDVTAAPPVEVGEEVELIGEHISVEEVAAAAGTISYEILTGLRVRH